MLRFRDVTKASEASTLYGKESPLCAIPASEIQYAVVVKGAIRTMPPVRDVTEASLASFLYWKVSSLCAIPASELGGDCHFSRGKGRLHSTTSARRP